MESFYERLGEERLDQLLDSFYDKVFESKIISHLFQQTPKDQIKAKQKLFITQFLGGPPLYNQTYGPPQMRRRHLPHAITIEAKEEWLRCMKESVDSLDWDETSKNTLYNLFPKLANHMVNR